jgi:hypothetical protein
MLGNETRRVQSVRSRPKGRFYTEMGRTLKADTRMNRLAGFGEQRTEEGVRCGGVEGAEPSEFVPCGVAVTEAD